jgi:hypothetical protein
MPRHFLSPVANVNFLHLIDEWKVLPLKSQVFIGRGAQEYAVVPRLRF